MPELERIARDIRSCTLCALSEKRTRAVPGEGPPKARILLLGEAPGRKEDEEGRPFVGSAGRILDRALASAGLRRGDVFLTNVVKCRPPGNRRPRTEEVAACRPYLEGQIEDVDPRVIVALGATALQALLGRRENIRRVRGRAFEWNGRRVQPTYHPAAVRYNRRLERSLAADLRIARRFLEEGEPMPVSTRPVPGRPTLPAISSGCVVTDDGRVLLLRKANEAMWCLPKGGVEAGESLQEAALREVEEECGLKVAIEGPVLHVRYRFYWPPEDLNYDKTVHYFLARRVGGREKLEPRFDEFRWCSRSEAMQLLYHRNDRDVLRAAFEML